MIYYTGKHKAQVGLPTGPNRQQVDKASAGHSSVPQVLFLSRVFLTFSENRKVISVRRSLKQQSSSDIAMHVSYVSILVNLVLSVGKFVAGIMGHSSAMISDAIHSASDVFSTIIVIFGVLLASRSSDADHPYGHEKQEYVATLFLAFVLMFTGLGIGYEGLQSILHKTYLDRESPALIAMAAAIVSIVTKEAMFWYTIRAARKINSGALSADAWHHRSDALSSIGSFIGILGARMGYGIMDPFGFCCHLFDDYPCLDWYFSGCFR